MSVAFFPFFLGDLLFHNVVSGVALITQQGQLMYEHGAMTNIPIVSTN